MIADAQELDLAFEVWTHILPEEWHFSVSQTLVESDQLSKLSYKGYAHKYSSLSHATVWSRCRVGRIITNSIYLRLLFTLDQQYISGICDAKYTSQRLFERRIIMDSLATDMCRGVAFFFENSHSKELVTSSSHEEQNGEFSPMLATLISWPLTVAASTEFLPHEQSQWLKDRLHTASETIGTDLLAYVADGDLMF